MNKGLTTIIVPCYIQTELSKYITMACIGNITKYTDEEDYELIVIEDIPKFKIDDPWHTFRINNHIVLKERTNYATKMNLAVKEANGEYLAFIQNDCFVYENWLPTLRWYIENKYAEAMIPHQFPSAPRKWFKEEPLKTNEETLSKGVRDACMIYMSKEAYDRTGGFNEELEALVEQDFYENMNSKGIRYDTTSKVVVTHIGLATHYQNSHEEFSDAVTHDSLLRNK